ncbi:MAG TPA: PTS sugar transporter subunit IIA [Actinomycetes bacterium]|nr:PTS sugar transporter subunit IIA [Actinomycetes bacterium]
MSPEPDGSGVQLLSPEAVRLGQKAANKDEAVQQCGEVLVELGAVEPAYVDTMHLRERSITTFLGEGVAIPHGTDESRVFVKKTTLAVMQYPDGVDWGSGNEAKMCIAIAAKGNEHMQVLSALARILLDPAKAERLRSASEVDQVLELLAPIGGEEEEGE